MSAKNQAAVTLLKAKAKSYLFYCGRLGETILLFTYKKAKEECLEEDKLLSFY